jgi:hypothetical protein
MIPVVSADSQGWGGYYILSVGGEATEKHRKDGRVLSTLGETEKRCKTGSKDKRYVKYSVIGECVDSSRGFNQDTRIPRGGEGRVFVDGEVLGVAQARVSNVGIRQASASYKDRMQCTFAGVSQPSVAWGWFCIVTRCTRRIVSSTTSVPWRVIARVAVAA